MSVPVAHRSTFPHMSLLPDKLSILRNWVPPHTSLFPHTTDTKDTWAYRSR